ncbi:MAG: nuclear transport factor 2 family protein [Prevotellaceae bacterium]|jgi:ketosteroid isomerase-like protein|nr:nuclear transport factor 2 family protein [Prevotellaceae bacterium]
MKKFRNILIVITIGATFQLFGQNNEKDTVNEESQTIFINKKQINMETENIEKDKEMLFSIVKEIAESFTGKQSTKYWADDALWFDIPPIAVKGKEKSCEIFESAFRSLKSINVEILSMEAFINGDMGIVCSVQRWNIVPANGTENPPLMVRQTCCFERRNGEWKLIHQHDSTPKGENWDGKILTE